MASRNFYLNIVVRSVLLAAMAIFAGWLMFAKFFWLPAVFILMLVVFQVVEMINYLNRTNRKIAFFFDAIRNEDSTLNFPVNTGNKSLNDLNASLNNLNELIKKIKFDLQEQEQFFKTILEHITIGIITFNESGVIYLSNSAARELLNHNPLTHINQLNKVDRRLFSAFREMVPGSSKLVSFNGKNGVVQLSLKSTLFKTPQENHQLVAVQDIKSEMETKELESWIKLIRVLTHEIMNTVAPITSLSQTLLGYYENLDGKKPDEKIIQNTMKGLNVINERGKGLINFVETYRKLTRLPQPDKKPISVKQLFESVIMLVSFEQNSKNPEIQYEIRPDGLEILVDKKQVTQVLINLIKNAIEALKENDNGIIKLTAELKTNGRPEISVTDNGPGIPADLQDKIFVPFFTTKESGSGIGLSLSRQIMQLHGGRIKIESKEGRFTTVSLIF